MTQDQEAQRSLTGQIAIVTGGGRGIGQAIAQALAAAGATVIIVGRSEVHLAETMTNIQASGGKAHMLVIDVADREAVAQGVKYIEEQFGAIDILINNAGRHIAL